MNRKWISQAFSDIDTVYIAESMTCRGETVHHAPERTSKMGKYENRNVRSRRFFSLIMAACLIFAMAITAYAANWFGIREMFHKLPEEAEPYIQEHTEAATAEDWNARITESLCDDSTIMVTVTVSGGDKYIVAPTDADPDTLAVNIGIEGDMTLGEYAASQGKELLFVGAAVHGGEALGIGNGSQSFKNSSASEMTILVKARKSGSAVAGDVTCHVYAVNEAWEKLTLDLPFTLAQVPSGEDGIYFPANADAIPGMTVGEAIVTQTPVGLTIRYQEIVSNEDALYDIKKVEFEGLVYGQGGTVLEDDGNWWFTVSGCTGEIGDTLTARYYNWDGQLIGEIVFIKK